MSVRLAKSGDEAIIIDLLALTGQLWSEGLAKEALASPDRMIVIHEDDKGTPDGVYMLRRTPNVSYLGPVSPSPREPGRTQTVMEMAAFLCQQARKKWPKDFVAGRRVVTSTWNPDAKTQLKGVLGNTLSITSTKEDGMEEYTIDLLVVEKTLAAYLPKAR